MQWIAKLEWKSYNPKEEKEKDFVLVGRISIHITYIYLYVSIWTAPPETK